MAAFCLHTFVFGIHYGVATISRFLKIVGLFCTRALSKRLYSAKETYHFKEPTNRSHPIVHAPPAFDAAVGDVQVYMYTYIVCMYICICANILAHICILYTLVTVHALPAFDAAVGDGTESVRLLYR